MLFLVETQRKGGGKVSLRRRAKKKKKKGKKGFRVHRSPPTPKQQKAPPPPPPQKDVVKAQVCLVWDLGGGKKGERDWPLGGMGIVFYGKRKSERPWSP